MMRQFINPSIESGYHKRIDISDAPSIDSRSLGVRVRVGFGSGLDEALLHTYMSRLASVR